MLIEAAHYVPVVGVRPAHHRGDLIQRRPTDEDRDRHVLALITELRGRDARAGGRVAHIDVELVLGPVHEPVDTLVNVVGRRIAADDIGVVEIGMSILGMMMEQRKHREVDVVAPYDHVLAGRGINHLGLMPQLRAPGDLQPNLGGVAFQREGIHRTDAIAVGEERELTVLDMFDEDRRIRILLHQHRKLVDPFLVADAS